MEHPTAEGLSCDIEKYARVFWSMTDSTKPNVELRRYVKYGTREDPNWAIIVIGSDGYFSSCSDWGNYAFIWGHHGRRDFREFLTEAKKDPYYFIGKLANGQEYDPEGTRDRIKEEILRMRREDQISRQKAREEWDLLERSDIENELELHEWMQNTYLESPWEWAHVTRYNRQVVAFVERIMAGWLAPLLEVELKKEAA